MNTATLNSMVKDKEAEQTRLNQLGGRILKLVKIGDKIPKPIRKRVKLFWCKELCPLCGNPIVAQRLKPTHTLFVGYLYYNCQCGYEFAKMVNIAPMST